MATVFRPLLERSGPFSRPREYTWFRFEGSGIRRQKMELDLQRHLHYFDPRAQHWDLHVIGVGALGSRVVYEAARMGIRRMHLYDHDVVEAKNIPNQRFYPVHIGMPKVEAACSVAQMISPSVEIVTHNEKFVDQSLSGVVCVMLDNMEARKDIWEAAIRRNTDVSLMIEARIAADTGKTFAVNPNNELHVESWEEAWHPTPEDAGENPCAQLVTIGSIADMTIGLSMQQLIRWAAPHNADGARKGGTFDTFSNYIAFSYFDEKEDSGGLQFASEIW